MQPDANRATSDCVLEGLDRAGRGLEEACTALLRPSPEALDQCAQSCRRAASELAACLPRMHSAGGRPEALAAAQKLSAAVRSARRLLENAAAYHAQWQAMLGALSAGYTCAGRPAPVIHTERLVLRG